MKGNYLLRNIPEEIWNKFRILAIRKGMNAKQLLISLIREAVKD